MLGLEEIIIGKENITKDVCDKLADLYQAELAVAESEQIKLMQAEKRLTGGERKNLPFGRIDMKICPEVYHFWGRKLSYDCWKNKAFRNDMKKRFGDLVKIKSVSEKIGV